MENKKKVLATVSSLGMAFVIGLMIFDGSYHDLNKTAATESDYSISFDKNTNKIGTEAWSSPSTVYSGNGFATTNLGNQVAFEYNSFANPTTVWQLIKGGGYFTNTDKISGMKSITITKTNSSSSFQVFWSDTKTFSDTMSATYDTTSTLTFTCNFSDYSPNYIKVVALGTGVSTITSGSILFSCANQYPTLNLTSNNPTMGSVTGGGTHKIGSDVTLTATPNPGHKFVGWYHGNELLSSSASYAFLMPTCVDNYAVEGRFLANSYNVVVSSEDTDKGSVTGGGSYDCQESVTISSTASSGYTFSGWYSGNTLISSENPYTFAMPYEDIAYVAKYSTNVYTLTLNSSGSGSVTGSGTYSYKASVSLSAAPDTGHSFAGWYDGETLVSSSNPYTFSMPSQDLSYTARFTTNTYAVAITSSELGTNPVGSCVLSGAGNYSYGTNATITATPASGYGFLGWYSGDTLVSSSNPYTFTVPANDVSYVAKYSKKYHVSVASYDESKGTVSGAGDFPYGSDVTVACSFLVGYNKVTWYDDSFSAVSSDRSYTFKMPESDVTLSADFAKELLGNSYYLGKYPQTVVEDSATLGGLATATDTDSDGYLEYNNAEYKKVNASPCTSGYKSTSGNVTFVSGTYYYFKVEPIEWRVLSGVGTFSGLVIAEKILTNSVYYTSTSTRTISASTIYPNNYQYSTLRAMLNGYDGTSYSVGNFSGKGFLDVAFTEDEKALITTTDVNNSAATTGSSTNSYACASTSDKIFSLSYQECSDTEYFSSTTKSQGVLSDYARATGAYMNKDSSYYARGYWWLRSPGADSSSFARSVNSDGHLSIDYVFSASDGVRPSFIVDIS
jgi:uncharacterized repeat protein (TIGR02543 family)